MTPVVYDGGEGAMVGETKGGEGAAKRSALCAAVGEGREDKPGTGYMYKLKRRRRRANMTYT